MSASRAVSPGEHPRFDTGPGVPVAALTLRIAVAGAKGAGTRTTVRALAERLALSGATGDRHPDGARALGSEPDANRFQYIGGSHQGRPIHVQVAAIGGVVGEQRRTVLGSADAILFVVESSETGLQRAVDALAEIRSVLGEVGADTAVVIQANHRDAPDARPLGELRSILRLAPETLVVETTARTGDGVRQAFVFAVRVGLRRAGLRSPEPAPVRVDEPSADQPAERALDEEAHQPIARATVVPPPARPDLPSTEFGHLPPPPAGEPSARPATPPTTRSRRRGRARGAQR